MDLFRSKKTNILNRLPSRVSSAALILEDNEGRALIVKANYKAYWTFPGGIVDPNETPKQAAIREVFEEIGVHVDSEKVVFVAVVNRKSDIANTYQFIFKASLPPNALSTIALQATEIDEYVLITKEQAALSDRTYGKVIDHWVHARTGYIEQIFDEPAMKR